MQLSRKMEDKANSGGNTAVEAAGNLTTPTKKAVKAKPKTAHSKASHPPTSEMVSAAIKELKDRKGSSVQAIKKYIATTYKVDGEKIAPFIKRYLKTAVTSGAVVQTKGKGASGSFKLSVGKGSENLKSKKRLRTPRKAESKKVQSVEKKTAAKKTVAPKKAASPKKTAAAKKPAAVKKTAAKAVAKPKADLKTMSKAKKTTKAPAAKTRIPKPKRTAAPKAVKSAKK